MNNSTQSIIPLDIDYFAGILIILALLFSCCLKHYIVNNCFISSNNINNELINDESNLGNTFIDNKKHVWNSEEKNLDLEQEEEPPCYNQVVGNI